MDSIETGNEPSRSVQGQYELWPYPRVPIVASVRRSHVWQLNVDYLWDRCGTGRPPARPRIWIAGCGTLQPYVFKLANPRARILATDVSRKSLEIARRRCLWHGMYGLRFEPVDLDDRAQYPDGPFDLIECFGVLMNLRDPGAALERMAARLSDGGVLRLMVYPHFSRRRVFQVQRLARLCGLRFDAAGHPDLLRRAMARLPVEHPLRFAFDSYFDARNDAGLVDGFLHAGDRGFTGLALGQLMAGAGLRPAFYFHRPWGQPAAMAAELGLEQTSQSFVLHYLDLWQELRTNFIVCTTRTQATPWPVPGLRPHPLFDLRQASDPLDLLRRTGHRILGVRLPSRTTEEDWRIGSDELRLMRRFARNPDYDPDAAERLRRIGLLLGGAPERPALRAVDPADEADSPLDHDPPIEIGEPAPNPFYRHLFAAWRCGPDESGGRLPELRAQLDRWAPLADPLESARCPFGLTPFGTWRRATRVVDDYLAQARRGQLRPASSYYDLRLPVSAHDQVRAFLTDLPAQDLPPAELTELWTLLFSFRRLMVP